ncbi:chaperonin 10-like protein [Rhexocercosporidium sp. MPI-PUGE-AT-0058]|nr:chaperonin 10-like protein [Rhexocercosporidium sp. MPI-PUGE-AT-0058]
MDAFMTRFLRSPCMYKIAIPTPKSTELLIKVAYVSLNPTDYKHASVSLPPSRVIGCDFSGTVEILGEDVDQSKFSKGDRVAGIIHGCKDSHTGAFAEHLVADANLCYKIPENVSLEKASTIGVGWISAMQALRKHLYSNKPDANGAEETASTKWFWLRAAEFPLLVYSAATNMGMHTVQQARLYHSEITIIALASARHHAYLQSLGANYTFDYSSPTVVEDVRGLKRDIRSGIDCHSEGSSTHLAALCMLPNGNDNLVGEDRRRIIRTLPPGLIRGSIPPSVRADEWILSYTALGKPFWFLFKYYPASPEDYRSSTDYLQALTPLLREQKVVPVKHRLMSGGLESISLGFDEMRLGRVRGEKLVYRVGGE